MENKKKRALLVDDYIFTRGLLARCLSDLAVETEDADDGEEAWKLMEAAFNKMHPFDFVFSDLAMPKMDGMNLLKKCKTDPRFKDTIFVVVTGIRDNKMILEALASGASDYITKPLVLEEVRPRVQAIMNRVK